MRIVIAGGHGKIALLLERLLAERGDQAVGLIRNPDHVADIRTAVENVLNTPTYKERAVELGAQYAKHDTFAEIHASIGEVIAQRGGVRQSSS